ncbi:MAG: hypothetical protein SH818_11765 [Saprospiraceae bacterium]|nr:hypothetical protein [Saprospiraceae bacterium]
MNPTNIVFFLYTKAHLLDLSGAAQVFYEANSFSSRKYRLHFVSINETITTEQGLQFANLTPMHKIHLNKNDMIVVVGIDFKSFVRGEMDVEVEKSKEWIKENYHNGVYLSSNMHRRFDPCQNGIAKRKKLHRTMEVPGLCQEKFSQSQIP